MLLDHHAVVGVAQLMGQGDDVAERAVIVGQHAALADRGDVGAEGAAHLAGVGIEVDPRLIEGPLHHVGHIRREGAEMADQIRLGVLDGVGRGVFAHGREQIPPFQAAFIAQKLCLGAQILPEHRQIFLNGSDHRLERGALHPALAQGHIQRRAALAQLALGGDLLLEGVERKADAVFDLVIATAESGSFCPR